jgi:hypothetical protein
MSVTPKQTTGVRLPGFPSGFPLPFFGFVICETIP